jgi:hypothetical protein
VPELTVTVREPLPKRPSLRNLERAIFRALQAAGCELLLQAPSRCSRRASSPVHDSAGDAATSSRGSKRSDFTGGRPAQTMATAILLTTPSGLRPGDPCSAWVR